MLKVLNRFFVALLYENIFQILFKSYCYELFIYIFCVYYLCIVLICVLILFFYEVFTSSLFTRRPHIREVLPVAMRKFRGTGGTPFSS